MRRRNQARFTVARPHKSNRASFDHLRVATRTTSQSIAAATHCALAPLSVGGSNRSSIHSGTTSSTRSRREGFLAAH